MKFSLKCIFLVVHLFILLDLFGQNYFPIKYNSVQYFTDSTKNIFAIRVDSISPDSSEFYFFKSLQYGLPNDCPDSNIQNAKRGGSWIGEKLIVDSSKTCRFITFYKDTVVIKILAGIGDSMKIFRNDTLEFRGYVSMIDTLTILGNVDSIKKISIMVFDTLGQLINHPANGKIIILSESNGIYEIMPLFFPYLLPFRQLCGKNNPEFGISMLTFGDVYDFEIGDEIHTSFYSEGNNNLGDLQYKNNGYLLKRIINKTLYADTLKYMCIRKGGNTHLIPGNPYPTITTTSYSDTVEISYYNLSNYISELIPEEELGKHNISISDLNNRIKSKINTSSSLDFIETFNDCFYQPLSLSGGYSYNDIFYEGLGSFYYNSSSDGFNYEISYSMPAYYKKGNETWGTPILPLGIQSQINKQQSTISFSPNPLTSISTFDIQNSSTISTIEIFDLLGRKIKTISNRGNSKIVLHKEDFQNGCYIYQATDESGKSFSGKFVVM